MGKDSRLLAALHALRQVFDEVKQTLTPRVWTPLIVMCNFGDDVEAAIEAKKKETNWQPWHGDNPPPILIVRSVKVGDIPRPQPDDFS